MSDNDLRIAAQFVNIEIREEPTQAPAKTGLFQKFSAVLSSAAAYISQKIGLFDAPAFIARINQNATPSNAPQEEIGYHNISAKVLADKNGVGVLRSDCARARKIASDCLNSMELQKNPAKIGVFRDMNDRAMKVQAQLDRIENVNNLKKKDPELAKILDGLYQAGKYEAGDQLFKNAKNISKNPDIRKFLKDPLSSENPQLFAQFCKFASLNTSYPSDIIKFLTNIRVIASNPDKLNDAQALLSNANAALRGKVNQGAFSHYKRSAENLVDEVRVQQGLKAITSNWQEMEQALPAEMDGHFSTREISLGRDHGVLAVEEDQYKARLAQAQIQVGDNLLWTGKLRAWSDGNDAQKQELLTGLHEDITRELNQQIDPPLTKEQSLNITSQILKLSSLNGLGNVANVRKKEYLVSHLGEIAMMASAGISLMPGATGSPNSTIKVTIEPDGTVVVKGPVSGEMLRTEPPKFYGVQAEARIKLEDLKNSSAANPPQWNITTKATPLFGSQAELEAYVT